MGAYANNIVFNSQNLQVTGINVKRVPATKKQVIGKKVVRISVPGVSAFEYELDITGNIIDDGTDIDTHRDTLIASDDAGSHAYVDGKHNGNYYINTGSLVFSDTGEHKSHYNYRMKLIQA